jgi:hypothetical protein
MKQYIFMEQLDSKYNQLLDKLRRTYPAPNNPDELTGNILRQIEQLQNDAKKNRIWSVTGWFSGIAAACFIAFMIWEMKQPSVSTSFERNSTTGTFVRYIPSIPAMENPNINAKKRQYYRILKKKQQIESAKQCLYENYMSYLNNK